MGNGEWIPWLLLFVFATHFPFFAWRYWKTRELRYAATSLTFALLVVTYALRVAAPDASAAGRPLYAWVRIPAAIAAAFSIALFLRHLVRRLACHRRGGGPSSGASPETGRKP